jgi:hypothetical protein
MAGNYNFRGVLIFVIFVVDLQSQKFPHMKITYEGRGQKIMEAQPTF